MKLIWAAGPVLSKLVVRRARLRIWVPWTTHSMSTNEGSCMWQVLVPIKQVIPIFAVGMIRKNRTQKTRNQEEKWCSMLWHRILCHGVDSSLSRQTSLGIIVALETPPPPAKVGDASTKRFPEMCQIDKDGLFVKVIAEWGQVIFGKPLLLFKPAGSLVLQRHASVPGALLEQQQAAVVAACHCSGVLQK